MNSFVRWCFQDRKTGRIVIGQMPNLTMWIVIVALALSFVVPPGRGLTAVRIVLFVSLSIWAIDEAGRGVNPWRRALGVGTLFGVLAWLFVILR